MDQNAHSKLKLYDQLEVVKQNGQWPGAWSALVRTLRTLNPTDREQWLRLLENARPSTAEVAWLRSTALLCLTYEPRHFAMATPSAYAAPEESLQTWLGLAWLVAMQRSHSAEKFSEQLNAMGYESILSILASKISSRTKLQPSNSRREDQIAIYWPDLANVRHGPTQFALNCARALPYHGYSVGIYTAHESTLPSASSAWGGDRFLRPEHLEQDVIDCAKDIGVPITVANPELSLSGRTQALANVLMNRRPRALIFTGFSSAPMFRLSDLLPVIGVSSHTVLSPIPQDVAVTASPQLQPWHRASVGAISTFTPRHCAQKRPLPDRTQRQKICIIAVGFRLDSEIDATWAAAVSQALIKFPKDRILLRLIGAQQTTTLEKFDSRINVQLCPPVSDIYPDLVEADIMVNPLRMGGGGAVASAMEMGIPVVSLAMGDGGRKINSAAVAGLPALTRLLEALLGSRQLREEVGQNLRTYFLKALDLLEPSVGAQIEDIIISAENKFIERKHQHENK